MRQAEVEILRISSFLMVFFYRRFLPLDVFIYAFGAENDASSSNLPIPFVKTTRLSQNLHLRQPRCSSTLYNIGGSYVLSLSS